MTTASPHEHLLGLARFFVPAARHRVRAAADDPRLRAKFALALAHLPTLDPSHVRGEHRDPISLRSALPEFTASHQVYVVSDSVELDDTLGHWGELLAAAWGDDGATLISVVPGRVAVYLDEAPRETGRLLRR